MSELKTIYVYLLNEGTETYRPATGINIKENIYRLEPIENYDSEDENWQFKPGSLVRCENKVLSGENCLVATELFVNRDVLETSRLVELWRIAAKDLGFSFVAPFELEDQGRKIQYAGLIENFGSKKGLLFFLYKGQENRLYERVAENNGFGYSCLSELLPEEKYNRESFIDILNDWGWVSTNKAPPSWYVERKKQMFEPTILEVKILKWLEKKSIISDQIKKAKVIDRRYSGAGFFFQFSVPKGILPVDKSLKTIEGPDIKSKYLPSGAGSIVFCEKGFVKILEVFSYDDFFPENLEDFELQESDNKKI